MALARSICKQHLDDQSGKLPVLTLAPDVEEVLAQSLMTSSGEVGTALTLALSPVYTQNLLKSVNGEIERVLSGEGVQPVILCNAKLRGHVRKLIERMLPQIAVLSYNEIGPSTQIQTYGAIRVVA
jgi:flagellar biosynthesis protein FlhA